ncbi:MAG: hypothetical protein QM504_10285 [Pseudomonadota bacterium]
MKVFVSLFNSFLAIMVGLDLGCNSGYHKDVRLTMVCESNARGYAQARAHKRYKKEMARRAKRLA